MEFLVQLRDGILQTSLLEWSAVLAAVLYLLLLSFKNSWCWLFAFISSSLYTLICVQAQLYLESFLQIFYVAMAVWGWVSWNKEEKGRPIRIWKPVWHLINIVLSSVLVVCLGLYFLRNTDQSYPFLDATTTVFSLTTTFLVIYRVLSNWVYWIVIDSLGMVLFYWKGLELTVVLYFLYTLLAIWGYYKWKKEYNLQVQ